MLLTCETLEGHPGARYSVLLCPHRKFIRGRRLKSFHCVTGNCRVSGLIFVTISRPLDPVDIVLRAWAIGDGPVQSDGAVGPRLHTQVSDSVGG